jgi:hypothetical protein
MRGVLETQAIVKEIARMIFFKKSIYGYFIILVAKKIIDLF